MTVKLIHKPTGDIYIYQTYLAARDDMEEFIEGEAEVVKEEPKKAAPKKVAPKKVEKVAPKPAASDDDIARELGI